MEDSCSVLPDCLPLSPLHTSTPEATATITAAAGQPRNAHALMVLPDSFPIRPMALATCTVAAAAATSTTGATALTAVGNSWNALELSSSAATAAAAGFCDAAGRATAVGAGVVFTAASCVSLAEARAVVADGIAAGLCGGRGKKGERNSREGRGNGCRRGAEGYRGCQRWWIQAMEVTRREGGQAG
ncbi:unnamed protein product [Closterium sp. NIES-53]